MVHYYKFRIFAPSIYTDVIVPGSTAADVPIQKLFLVTTTGGFDGVIGKPIIEYHTADGVVYSDFMSIQFVTAPQDYVEDTFKSLKDVKDSGATVTDAGIIVNMPVVPTGSHLQHPETKGTAKAPIEPVPVWYNCVEVWTYVFEVTDITAAEHFAYTRPEESPVSPSATRALGSGFEIAVTPSMGSAATMTVNSIPIWHINQYGRGVEAGTGGGPDPNGMRNVINLDRPDAGYSPLWQAFWATELPIDYSANEASNNVAMSSANGFEFFVTPMFINCPNIGPVDKGVVNEDKTDEFTLTIDMGEESAWLLGSHMSLIFQAEMPVTFVSAEDGTEIGSTMTNIMGAYEYQMMTADIPSGTGEVKVMSGDTVIRTISVVGGGESSAPVLSYASMVASLVVGLVAAFL